MRAYRTTAGDEHDLCSRNDLFSENGPKAALVPVLLRETRGAFAAGSDSLKL